ncbi:MAG: ribose 5-phosphate isomerase B [Candidatus Melainabacteria bacterium RIFOXYA12_FULL_32_12]|nr:MAG: ribose 5-phosphate isomerase B [Candidatus Melainabacteria bacterium GWF2_32_7]OGI21076.1 MAG: ribose 5-phosphate isomerase B [Candidatus Melainabacteria bacterium RIFOXYA2_FULL_32_9]OGI27211.1 MAG: ribose 5-phosphate isomerase B [Candidatus Melainabacteria bacterium RIFOXYA12_FULL_32_12]
MENFEIAIGSDHGGFELKQVIISFLEKNGYKFKDFGVYNNESIDYPVIAREVASSVANNAYQKGILICGSGLGVAIAANKIKGVRAVTCHDTYCARMSRAHNNANILTLGGRVVGPDVACDIVKVWLETEFEGGRHQRRVDMIE